jgi:cell division protein ZapE
VTYASSDDSARRFISLIDELYDQNVSLYLSADVPLAELYTEGALSFEFRRTYSRLMEMSRWDNHSFENENENENENEDENEDEVRD